jgi:SAM-dependent methyltransferase
MSKKTYSSDTKQGMQNDAEGAKDTDQAPLLNRIHADHTEQIHALSPGGSLLGIGCGRNPIKTPPTVDHYCVDISLPLLNQATRKTPTNQYIQASGSDLPFRDRQFETVFMRGVLHQLSENDRQLIIEESYRVLRRGGQLIIYEPDPTSLYRRLTWFIADQVQFDHENSPYVDTIGYPEPDAIDQWCREAGFSVEKSDRTGSLLTPVGFLYPYKYGINILDTLRPMLPVNWWHVVVAERIN